MMRTCLAFTLALAASSIHVQQEAFQFPNDAEVALEQDMKTKMVVFAAKEGPCDAIECGDLDCPDGFTAKAKEGHCCKFCINPDIVVKKVITGATGEAGGKQSAFCPGVWCFPTLCVKEVKQPTVANKQCCAICPAKEEKKEE
eukprot:TRINITY_DN78552_c0_g1_i1.p1 TRINITY_DN78552_c0_g1~~TRINITY_DN78552_c0_g1_i1.p1  ORF type:complete len:143 (+),score=53.29 TRINITY_DN78552_c0_g1_i1:72-500(+)